MNETGTAAMTVPERVPAPAGMAPRPSGKAPAVALFFLSPLVGEFLFGNVSIGALWFTLVVAPMYGGGALLIREVVRRSGRGWRSIFLLALAYSVIEEGLVTQLLFNPSYSTYGVEVTGPTYIAFFGINAVMTVSVVTLHTVWSICVPIAMVEALAPQRCASPWLGNLGLTVTALLFCCGSAYVTYGVYQEENFLASALQLGGGHRYEHSVDRRRASFAGTARGLRAGSRAGALAGRSRIAAGHGRPDGPERLDARPLVHARRARVGMDVRRRMARARGRGARHRRAVVAAT